MNWFKFLLGATAVAALVPYKSETTEETRLPDGRVNVLLGQGQTAQVLRNLCGLIKKIPQPAGISVSPGLRCKAMNNA